MKRFLSLLLSVLMVMSCTVLVSNAVVIPEITKQPTAGDLSVEVSLPDGDVSYQWYVLDEENSTTVVIDNTVAAPTADTPMANGSSSYDSENGVWLPATNGEGYYEFFLIELSKGDSFDVTFNGFKVDDCGIGSYETSNAFWGVENKDGSYTVTAFADGEYVLFAYEESDASLLALNESAVYAQAAFVFYDSIALEGETGKKLTKYELGKTYFCEIEVAGHVLTSDYVTIEQYFTKQPTLDDASVELSFPELIESYQWYKLGDEYTEAEITPANAASTDIKHLFTNMYGDDFDELPSYIEIDFLTGSSRYDSESGWLPSVMTLSMPSMPASAYIASSMVQYSSMYFEIDVEAGSEVYVQFSEDMSDADVRLADMESSIELIYDEESDTYTATVEEAGAYYLAASAPYDISGVYANAVATVKSYSAIEGETGAALTELEPGNKYFCAATSKDGNVYCSVAFVADYRILQQPTAADPTLKVSFADDATYKWFIETETLTKAIDDTVTDSADGTYDSETGEWTGYANEPYEYMGYQEYRNDFFYVELKAGDTVKVILSNPAAVSPEDPEMRFYAGNSEEIYYVEFDENGVGYITIKEDDLYEVYHYCISPETTTIKFELIESVYEEIEGETEATLKSFEVGERYYASATYENGTVLESDTFVMEYAITKQPTADDLSVEVNFPEDVESYEWFYTVSGEVPVTDENATLSYYDGDSLTEGYYDAENGCWVPSLYDTYVDEYDVTYYEYDLFHMELKAGDILVITPSAELLYGDFETWNEYTDMSYNDDWVCVDGVYSLEITDDGLYWFYTYTYDEDITFEAYVITKSLSAIEGESTNALKNVEYGVEYVCAVTFEDGTVLYSDSVVVEEPEYILGDVNDDGAIDQFDYILVKRHYFATRLLTENEMAPADVNNDGSVDQFDYILIRRHYFGTYTIG